ncbi:MAG: UDP-2,3-diacylglucosamine diphosphatase [Gammaproteobacteria bacterium]|nr:UDP-2,3-diacylglucosamine diphosphatase [Gammaproteobacteria bacterium]
MTTLFISDLHLEAARPDIGDQFLEFLETEAAHADALYILGDLFESWIGDDDPNTHYAEMKSAIRRLSDSGVPVYFMHGNRDFMIGEQFARDTGVTILPDPVVVDMYGEEVLLSHGDAWCTDDVQYQQMRKMTRNPEWQSMMRQKPLAERQAIAAAARAESVQHGKEIDDTISDVNAGAVEQAFVESGVTTMLHGHTHRPAVHELTVDGRPAMRIVLGDWYEHGSVVRWDDNGPDLVVIER